MQPRTRAAKCPRQFLSAAFLISFLFVIGSAEQVEVWVSRPLS